MAVNVMFAGRRYSAATEADARFLLETLPDSAYIAHDKIKVGSRYISKHQPVRVIGKQGTWKVVAISEHSGGRINVEVVGGTANRDRHFPLDKIRYVAPSSQRAKAVAATR